MTIVPSHALVYTFRLVFTGISFFFARICDFVAIHPGKPGETSTSVLIDSVVTFSTVTRVRKTLVQIKFTIFTDKTFFALTRIIIRQILTNARILTRFSITLVTLKLTLVPVKPEQTRTRITVHIINTLPTVLARIILAIVSVDLAIVAFES
jgi:hypothetical protein